MMPRPKTKPLSSSSAASGSGSDEGDLQPPPYYYSPGSQAALDDSSPLLLPPGSRSRKPEISGASFTVRGVAVGLLVGLVICFSNMYFGLQTGWVSTMTMPASLLGFGIFRTLRRHLGDLPFSPVENVLIQTVAGSMAIMPLGCGFVGVIPAMNYLLRPEEQGPINLDLWKLVLWSLGLCYFGVVFAVPLRRQVIIRERLKFPSGFSTAVLISVLHGTPQTGKADGGFASLVAANPDEVVVGEGEVGEVSRREEEGGGGGGGGGGNEGKGGGEWKRNVQLLLLCFLVSGMFTLATYFFPILRNIPIFGSYAAATWLWTLNPSLAYVGQGIIMGPATTLHMLLGAVVGWGILSPLAKNKGWAPGKVDNWENGSKGWIVWISLAIMLADSVVSLGYLALRSLMPYLTSMFGYRLHRGYRTVSTQPRQQDEPSTQVPQSPLTDLNPDHDGSEQHDAEVDGKHDVDDDAPPEQQISNRVVAIGLAASIIFCISCIHVVFGDLVPLYATVTAVLMALVLSIMGVRALGETDLNPVSGISKLAQLFFALIIPQSNPSSVLINLVAGAVSEAGALQAGDMMQDLKTGHLLGAAPSAQFWGQAIGATVGAVVSAFIYRLYTAVYEVPGDLFAVPTGYVWIFTARLVTGEGLPRMAKEWAIASAILFAITTAVRVSLAANTNSERRGFWHAVIPGGIAVAVGMYNVPSFTLARTIGGLLSWWWRSYKGWQETPLIVLASGFILGEGFLSIVNLIMQSIGVPHL
ncbi:OPT oligopeptide transporter protein-domain-containing protein [Diplogelasinospora grovesii]|uniref:OPT oligopeptide transporter protein-domain-containing protein n=1 Tax=Diplogelasinospora grovesii TaxID=303347 RepID=A0AAN6SA81_9PEZI|nr:OPT oligopeptide transporter protein-domain-containing protein [Diplogelasinospora grovesii]